MSYKVTGPSCEEPGCIRPPYECNLCYPHWMLLSKVEKRVIQSLTGQQYAAPRPPVAAIDLDSWPVLAQEP